MNVAKGKSGVLTTGCRVQGRDTVSEFECTNNNST